MTWARSSSGGSSRRQSRAASWASTPSTSRTFSRPRTRLPGDFKNTGRRAALPQPEAGGSPEALLSEAGPGDYLAVLAYIRETPETNEAFTQLRRRVMERYRIATTVGYGPRFLHSTGQAHKGGPNNGLFLQISAEREDDIPVPRESYTFGVLADAQALGDVRALRAQGRRVAGVRLKAQPSYAEQIRRIAERI